MAGDDAKAENLCLSDMTEADDLMKHMDALRNDMSFQNYAMRGMVADMDDEIHVLRAQMQSSQEENCILIRSMEKLEFQLKSGKSSDHGK